MIFRKPPKRRAENFRDETPFMRVARYALILALFGAVLWGLWENNNRRRALMEHRADPVTSARLSAEEEAKVEAYAERFFAEYGLPLIVEVRSEPPSPNALAALAGVPAGGGEAQRVVLVLCPPEKKAYFQAPAAVRLALGDDAKALAGPLFVPYFASGDWRGGLVEALRRIALRLDAAYAKPKESDTP